MEQPVLWAAIGDSFTYLNDHLNETGYRVTKGYLTRICDALPFLRLNNTGVNGADLECRIFQKLPFADLYTVLLGTNDWHGGVPLGSVESFRARSDRDIAGRLGLLLDRIRKANPQARIIVGTPVSRGDFVYILDHFNNARGSWAPEKDRETGKEVWLRDVAQTILRCCEEENVPCIDLYDEAGFTQENAVIFKHVRCGGGYEDLPYPDYCGVPFDPAKDEYPYPPEAVGMTYDGLHPSDEGNARIAGMFIDKIKEIYKY